jgi:hypothetical protein
MHVFSDKIHKILTFNSICKFYTSNYNVQEIVQ